MFKVKDQGFKIIMLNVCDFPSPCYANVLSLPLRKNIQEMIYYANRAIPSEITSVAPSAAPHEDYES